MSYSINDAYSANGLSKDRRHLRRYIAKACDPYNFEPNLALNIDVAEYINQKKGNFPREAALQIVKLINDRNPTISMLALNLLDILVKNCGYPFHLQIATKEFLNELVRRFPEDAPPRTGKIQNKILGMIEQWRRTLCETSRHKEDLTFIKDMHRLLVYKGYRFPEVSEEGIAVLTPSENIKSLVELEEEDMEALSAKLQELIRRGTPRDLQEANKIMKIMAGYDSSRKSDYKALAAAEIEKLRAKATLLGEMLLGVKPEGRIDDNDIYSEMATQCASAQAKIQKICTEESEDSEAVSKILALNDYITLVVSLYDSLKKSEFEKAEQLKSQLRSFEAQTGDRPKTSTPASFGNLIDFEDEAIGLTPNPEVSKNAPSDTENRSASVGSSAHSEDLLGLGFHENPRENAFGLGGNIRLNGSIAVNKDASSTETLFENTSKNLLTRVDPSNSSSHSGIEESCKQKRFMVFKNQDFELNFLVQHNIGSKSWRIIAECSNLTLTSTFSELDLQIAVPKYVKLTMQPPNKTELSPLSTPISQVISMSIDDSRFLDKIIRIKWKLSFKADSLLKTESGEFSVDYL